jgi:hypothetical protein
MTIRGTFITKHYHKRLLIAVQNNEVLVCVMDDDNQVIMSSRLANTWYGYMINCPPEFEDNDSAEYYGGKAFEFVKANNP